MKAQTLIGPFREILTLESLPHTGPIRDNELNIIKNGGIVVEGEKILAIGPFEDLRRGTACCAPTNILEMENDCVALPGLIDAHTHLCFAGSRAKDYALRVSGKSYLEIAKAGGGILDTVRETRKASVEELSTLLHNRCERHLQDGVTTCEVKSGYGLSVEDELKMLHAIKYVSEKSAIDLVPTCLAAHTRPPEFQNNKDYLEFLIQNLLPKVKKQNLANRIDIFVETSAFSKDEALPYLQKAKELGFTITVHADQFSTGGSDVAAKIGALSADHLEVSKEKNLLALKKAGVIATVLPGSSLGLGLAFAPARKILDHGLCLVIASDWNPGSAPMGDLFLQACVLGVSEKLSLAETLAGLTFRAAKALSLNDRGQLTPGKKADFLAFPTNDYREIFWHQGKMKPVQVWKGGQKIHRSQPAMRLY